MRAEKAEIERQRERKRKKKRKLERELNRIIESLFIIPGSFDIATKIFTFKH